MLSNEDVSDVQRHQISSEKPDFATFDCWSTSLVHVEKSPRVENSEWRDSNLLSTLGSYIWIHCTWTSYKWAGTLGHQQAWDAWKGQARCENRHLLVFDFRFQTSLTSSTSTYMATQRSYFGKRRSYSSSDKVGVILFGGRCHSHQTLQGDRLMESGRTCSSFTISAEERSTVDFTARISSSAACLVIAGISTTLVLATVLLGAFVGTVPIVVEEIEKLM